MFHSSVPAAKLLHSGKVRDIYAHGDNLLIVSTDRISAFDYILHEIIPDKGKILNRLSCFWFDLLKNDVENHILTSSVSELPSDLRKDGETLDGRFMYVKKATPLKVEAIVRGYLTGSGWQSYKKEGAICGIALPPGLRESEKFPEPLFTPTSKADVGQHDENMSMEEVENLLGKERAREVKELAIRLFKKASAYAESKGLILADTKLEFGLVGEKLILIDECFTPDSSRYWITRNYEVGKPQNPYDKQVVRDYLLSTDWDRNSTPPHLPEEIVAKARERYLEVYRILTGHSL